MLITFPRSLFGPQGGKGSLPVPAQALLESPPPMGDTNEDGAADRGAALVVRLDNSFSWLREKRVRCVPYCSLVPRPC